VLIDQPFAASDALTLFLESIENIIWYEVDINEYVE
jgi:hypothetical protein